MKPTRPRVLLALIRREFWEHRILWMAPVAVAVLLIACALFAHTNLGALQESPWSNGDAAQRSGLLSLVQWGLTLPEYLVMVIVLNFYLVDCLFAERRDRSILFWKSLPVSDAMTVVSKLFVGLVVVPVGVYFLALVTSLLFSWILLARAAAGYFPADLLAWDTMSWLRMQVLMLLGLIICILWYAPIAAYLLLISAWARRNALMWSILPPVFALLIEKYALGTSYVANLIAYRTWGVWADLNLEGAVRNAGLGSQDEPVLSVSRLFAGIHFGPAFANIDLWLGVVVAAGLAFAAARLRRYREDT